MSGGSYIWRASGDCLGRCRVAGIMFSGFILLACIWGLPWRCRVAGIQFAGIMSGGSYVWRASGDCLGCFRVAGIMSGVMFRGCHFVWIPS